MSNLKILLISPPYARFMGVENCRFPITFGSMSTILSQDKYDVAIYDADFDVNLIGKTIDYETSFLNQSKIQKALLDSNHYVWKEIEQTVRNFEPDVVGITTMTSKFPMAIRIAEIAKRLDPEIKVVIGGHHSTILGPTLVQNENLDFAVIGEGEETFRELIQQMGQLKPEYSSIRGLIYKENGSIISTQPRGLIEDLDVLPIADRDLILNDNYISENNIMISRGCPFNCSYCGAQVIWGRKVRKRSVNNVVKEIEYLLQHSSSRNISFWDDSFTCDRKYTQELMCELKKIDGLKFSCITRLDLIDKDILTQLKEAGCSQILFGIESGNNKILKLMDKKMDCEFIKKQISLVKSVDIPWLGFFIMGYPGETKENILETLSFMKELNPTYAEINIFSPLPGTKIWDDLAAKGKINQTMDFSRFSQSSTDDCFTVGTMTKNEFKELALYMAREFDKHNRRRNKRNILKNQLCKLLSYGKRVARKVIAKK